MGGTEVMTSADHPKLEVVYKLSEIIKGDRAIPKMKLSSKKITYPGKKQVYRLERSGIYQYDTIGLEQDNVRGAKLLLLFIKNGKLIRKIPTLDQSAKRYQNQLIKFNPKLKSIERSYRFPIRISKDLQVLTKKTQKQIHTIN